MKDQQKLNAKIARFYWQHAWRYKARVISLITTVVLAVLFFRFLPPLVSARIIERVSAGDFTRGDLWGSFGAELVLFAGTIIFGGVILWRIAIILLWELEMRVLRDIHQEVFNHLIAQSANFHANRFGGSLVSQANKFASSYIRMQDTTLFEMLGLILSFVFTIIILAPRAPGIVVALLVFSLLFMLSAARITRHVREVKAKESSLSNKQTGALADAVTNVMAVKGFAAGPYERRRYSKAVNATKDATYKLMRVSTTRDIYFSVTTGILTIGSLGLSLASVVLWNANIGTVFLVIVYAGMISQSLWEFCQSTLRNYNHALGDARDMIEIFDINPAIRDPVKPEPSRIAKGAIEFKDMTFSHNDDDGDDGLFNGLKLSIKPGEKIGLVGHSGSGKTTLTRLLLRFNDIDSGEILIDGQNIAAITQDDLRSSIAYVPQEPLLFHRSIAENIAYGSPGAKQKEIEDAAHRAYADEFIVKLPQGYDTLVGERGVKLSGGQRQRVVIARAILKDAPILVLDEATSALDSESERLIQSALWELMQNRTAIVIAHRLSTVQKMDRILVLDNGQITEQGSHADLVKKNGTYAKLWAHQSGGFIED